VSLSEPLEREVMTRAPRPIQASQTIIVKNLKTNPDINLDLKNILLAANKVDSDKTSKLKRVTTKCEVILIFKTIKAKQTHTHPPTALTNIPIKKK